MEIKGKIRHKKSFKDFVGLALSFFVVLTFLGFYQQARLFYLGYIDQLFGKSTWILTFNHLGFTALISIILLVIFRILEQQKNAAGYRFVKIMLNLSVLLEAIFIEYYLRNLELVGANFSRLAAQTDLSLFTLLLSLIPIVAALYFQKILFRLSSRYSNYFNQIYIVTLVLFTLVIAHYWTPKPPLSRNKTEYFIAQIFSNTVDLSDYEDIEEFPFTHKGLAPEPWPVEFSSEDISPNIYLVTIDNLSAEFTDDDGAFRGFTPFLNSLKSKSLYWSRFYANGVTKKDALFNISGSLPYANSGFVNHLNTVDRNTLFGILKQNGYQTGYFYGGNTALDQTGLFTSQERVDYVLDQSKFGDGYKLQETDGAGVTLGYPDLELYKKWEQDIPIGAAPKFYYFSNLSSTAPYKIPQKELFHKKIQQVKENSTLPKKYDHFFSKNKELFASIAYADYGLQRLIGQLEKRADSRPSIIIITGTAAAAFPTLDPFSKYHVPLFIYHTDAKLGRQIETITSHRDLAPSLLSLLQNSYDLKVPNQMSFMGGSLWTHENKTITFSEKNKRADSFISEDVFYASGVYLKEGNGFEAIALNRAKQDTIQSIMKQNKRREEYALLGNQWLPQSALIYKVSERSFSKEDMVWISSVFSGNNYDNAYFKARQLAHQGQHDRALLLTDYILQNVPTHVDAMVLKGRIYAWQKQYEIAAELLEQTVKNYPVYRDGYAALLDVYFWSGKMDKLGYIVQEIEKNNLNNAEFSFKINRLYQIEATKQADNVVDVELNNE